MMLLSLCKFMHTLREQPSTDSKGLQIPTQWLLSLEVRSVSEAEDQLSTFGGTGTSYPPAQLRSSLMKQFYHLQVLFSVLSGVKGSEIKSSPGKCCLKLKWRCVSAGTNCPSPAPYEAWDDETYASKQVFPPTYQDACGAECILQRWSCPLRPRLWQRQFLLMCSLFLVIPWSWQ